MTKEAKTSALGDQIKSAQKSMQTWPEWMRDAAKFSGQPANTEKGTVSGKSDEDTKKDPDV